ncbi:hypothetical protein LCGC14_1320500 [marine sediment metagenome]|uniref:FCP1 homology domain-containing protein n=1 Tax=marine sediment metagenome TaxID=412755 RepID=A0A0F9KJR6_9ZZZZ
MKLRVLLDMDGVIANFYKEFGRFLNEEYGCTLPLDEEPASYSFNNWGHGVDRVPIDEASNKWILSGGLQNIPPYEGMEGFVRELMITCNVYVVTARVGDWQRLLPDNVKDTIKRDTYKWLEKYYIPSEKLYFSHEKIEFCKEHGISVMIEDKPSTALEASKNGIHTILMNRGYNGSQIDRFRIYRAYSYDDALKQLRKLEQ